MNPVRVLQVSQQTSVSEEPKEVPLSPDEVSRLKQTFRFLREHRQLLKLRVNAHEDLLLNGKREPTHRGVCQHLLAKVDKSRVLQASERLSPGEATRFLAGVIRFAPELPYLLRFLECVRASAGQQQAAAALTQALSQIDIDDASGAQVRQLIELICDVFPERELPAFLLGLLDSAAFRQAFDRSTEGFPSSLAQILVPLREVHRLVSQSRNRRSRSSSRLDPTLLSQGALLLLQANHETLLGLNTRVRKELFALLCDLGTRGDRSYPPPPGTHVPVGALLALYESLQLSVGERGEATLDLCSLLLQSGSEQQARSLLRKAGAAAQGAARTELEGFLHLLDQPRVGPIALSTPAHPNERKGSLPPAGRFYNGVHLHNRRKVRVLFGEKGEQDAFSKKLEIWREVLLPQVQIPIAWDLTSNEGPPFLAIDHIGDSLTHGFRHASRNECRALLLDLCRLKAALDGQGIVLPDGDLRRFSVDEKGHVWVSDLSEAKARVDSESSQDWLKDAIARAEKLSPFLSLSEDERRDLQGASSARAMARALQLL